MSPILSSQGVVLATAMVVSSTVIYFTFSRQKTFPSSSSQKNTLRSCLYSEDKKREKKKKRVHFAENVKDTNENGELYRKERSNKSTTTITRREVDRNCRGEIPANRVALYNGILRDRGQRIECSH
ncbi:hypothetical protein CFOL_v3_30483 [Cephalotus follicularis]|uniref:Transmembrane protein n=1 Tax=Cephalotus follicularis TaxID=3775 RepID=A0A1Q3D3H9_CEPFO|nr:hypothetical protein CFOL_v3_30483 [Cephalotus follicularis]